MRPSGSLTIIQMYRLLKEWLQGTLSLFPWRANLEEASESLKQATRRFAKRQLTWFRNRMQVTFYQIGEPGVQDRIFSQIEEFLDD